MKRVTIESVRWGSIESDKVHNRTITRDVGKEKNTDNIGINRATNTKILFYYFLRFVNSKKEL